MAWCIKGVNRSASAAFAPDGTYMAAGTMAGAVDLQFSSSANLDIFELDFVSDDRQLILAGTAPSSERFNRISWGKGPSNSEEYSLGLIAGGLVDGNIGLWNPKPLICPDTSKKVTSENAFVENLSRHRGPVRGLEFNSLSPNLLASGADEGDICIWDVSKPSEPSHFPPLKGSGSATQGEISFLSWNSKVQHILASTSFNGTTVVWDLKKQKPVISFSDSIRRRCSVMQWNPDVATQLIVASDEDSSPTLRLWDMRNIMTPVKEFVGHTKGVIAMSWCPIDSSYLLTCAKDNRTICWDTVSGEIVAELPAGTNWNFDVHWYSKIPGVVSASSFDGKIGIYNIEFNFFKQTPSDHTSQQMTDLGIEFQVDQRVHFAGKPQRTGTVKYVGPVDGYSGTWIGVDWDANGEGRHDGSHNGVNYFTARGPNTASFVRPHNLSVGASLLEALQSRYRTVSTKEEEDEMYVLSARNKRVSIELLGKEKIQDKLSRFEELRSASLSYLGVRYSGSPDHIHLTLPNLKELDLTGNLLDKWEDVRIISEALPSLAALNLSNNSLSPDITTMPELRNIRILVLNHTGLLWKQVELLKDSLLHVEELHLMGNKLQEITPMSATVGHGFNSLRLLNLENNCIAAWDEIIKLSQLNSLEQLFLNNNNLNRVWYPDCGTLQNSCNGLLENSLEPFKNLCGLFLANNKIEDLDSVDSLNSFPNLTDVRLSENPVADLRKGGVPRFIFIARLRKVEIFNGSEISPRERKDSEIRYVRLVMSKCSLVEIRKLHPRFVELKNIHGIEDERPSTGALGHQKLASGLISISFKCVGASMGEKPLLVKKLPATTTVGKLKNLCESFFKLKSVKPILFLQEEGSPIPALLEDDMQSLMELEVGNGSSILVDEES